MLTENIQMTNFVTDLKTITTGIIFKKIKEAATDETLASKKAADIYIGAIENGDLWSSYITFDYDVLEEAGIPAESIEACMEGIDNIPYALRTKCMNLQKTKTINNYVEQNNYYRMLHGEPNLDDTDYLYMPENSYGIPTTTPVHLLSDSMINIAESKGLIADLLTANPTKLYLNHLSDKKVDYRTARNALNYEILYLPSISNSIIATEFAKAYSNARAYFMISMYNPDLSSEFTWYDEFMGLSIMIMAIQRTIANIYDQGLTRDFYDPELIRYLFNSYSVPYIEGMSMDLKKNIAKNLNLLLMYKSTDKVLYDISYIMGFYDINIYKYYLVKDHVLDKDGNPTFPTKVVDGKTVPNYLDMYTFHFQKVNLKTTDLLVAKTDAHNNMTYESLTGNDNYWIDDEELMNKLYTSKFNSIITKYMSMDVSIRIVEMLYESCHTIRMILDDNADYKYITVNVNTLSNAPITLFNLVLFICAMGAKKLGLAGGVPLKGYPVANIYGFNFSADLDAIKMDIKNHVGDYQYCDDSVIDYIVNMTANSPEDVATMYNNITALRKVISNAMIKTTDQNVYRSYSKLYHSLLTTEDSKTVYVLPDGRTASTYAQLLQGWAPDLYSTYESVTTDSDFDDLINACFVAISKLNDQYYYIKSIYKSNVVYEYILKFLKFLKSYTVDFVNSGLLYVCNDPTFFSIKLTDQMIHGLENFYLYHGLPVEGRNQYVDTVRITMNASAVDKMNIRDMLPYYLVDYNFRKLEYGNPRLISKDTLVLPNNDEMVKENLYSLNQYRESFWLKPVSVNDYRYYETGLLKDAYKYNLVYDMTHIEYANPRLISDRDEKDGPVLENYPSRDFLHTDGNDDWSDLYNNFPLYESDSIVEKIQDINTIIDFSHLDQDDKLIRMDKLEYIKEILSTYDTDSLHDKVGDINANIDYTHLDKEDPLLDHDSIPYILNNISTYDDDNVIDKMQLISSTIDFSKVDINDPLLDKDKFIYGSATNAYSDTDSIAADMHLISADIDFSHIDSNDWLVAKEIVYHGDTNILYKESDWTLEDLFPTISATNKGSDSVAIRDLMLKYGQFNDYTRVEYDYPLIDKDLLRFGSVSAYKADTNSISDNMHYIVDDVQYRDNIATLDAMKAIAETYDLSKVEYTLPLLDKDLMKYGEAYNSSYDRILGDGIDEHTAVYMDGNSFVDSGYSKTTMTVRGTPVLNGNTGYGGVYKFSSDNDGITFPYTLSGDYTVDFWVKFDTLGVRGSIISNYSNSGGTGIFIIEISGYNCFRTFMNNDGVLTDNRTSTAVTADTWYHLAIVKTRKYQAFYINGKFIYYAAKLTGDAIQSSTSFVIGGENYRPFMSLRGQIDNFRISDYARWTSDFQVPVRKRKDTLHRVSKQTVTGTESLVTLDDSVDNKNLLYLTVNGNSTQDGTPTISAPIDIVSVGDSGSITVTGVGKNLFYDGLIMDNGASRSVVINTYNIFIPFVGKPVTVSFDIELNRAINETTGERISMYPYQGCGLSILNVFLIVNFNGNTKCHSSISTKVCQRKNIQGCTLGAIGIYAGGPRTASDIIIKLSNVQIEISDIETAYEPYISDSETITLSEPLRKISRGNDYSDKLLIDFTNSNISVSRNIKEIILTGNESWVKSTRYFSFIYCLGYAYAIDAYCNLCNVMLPNHDSVSTYVHMGISAISGNYCSFETPTNGNPTWDSVDALVSYLKSQYSAGNPVVIDYALRVAEDPVSLTWSDDYKKLNNPKFKHYYITDTTKTSMTAVLDYTYNVINPLPSIIEDFYLSHDGFTISGDKFSYGSSAVDFTRVDYTRPLMANDLDYFGTANIEYGEQTKLNDALHNSVMTGNTMSDRTSMKDHVTYTVQEASLATASASGVLTITDASNNPIQMLTISGKSVQTKTTQGKNLWDPKKEILSSSITHTNGVYYASDADTRSYMAYKLQQDDSDRKYMSTSGSPSVIINSINTRYSISQTIISGCAYLRLANVGKTSEFSIFLPLPSNVTVGDTVTISFRVLDMTIGASSFDQLQLEKASAVTTYEAYIPDSPSPNYPAPISSVCEGKSSIEIRSTGLGINLWGGEALRDDMSINVQSSSDYNPTIDNTNRTISLLAGAIVGAALFTMSFKENTQYTLILYGKNNDYKYTNFGFAYTDGTFDWASIKFAEINTNEWIVYTSIANKTIKEIRGVWYGGVTTLYYDKCGLFEGVLTLDDFEPYKYKSITIPLSAPLRSSMESRSDVLVINPVDKAIYIRRNANYINLKDTSTVKSINFIASTDYYYPTSLQITMLSNRYSYGAPSLSSHFASYTKIPTEGTKGYQWSNNAQLNFCDIYATVEGMTSLSDYNTWIVAQTVPVEWVYPLSDAAKYTETLTWKDEYADLLTYAELTIISINSAVPATISATYIQS